MKPSEMKERAAAAGLDWPAVKAIYDELRAAERASIERPIEARRIAFAALGHGHGGRWKLANRHATTDGDLTNVRHFDDVARELSATELPELGADDPAAELWALVNGDAPEMPPAAETFERALDRARIEAPRAPVSPDDLLPLPLAAALADVSEQWLRELVKAGKVDGFPVGRFWVVRRSSAESFKRHPTAGRPRKEAAPF
jgi:hypothetical protein